MDYQRVFHGQFKQHAFIWKPAFNQRQTDSYASENNPFVVRPVEDRSGATIARDSPSNISTEDVVDRFVNHQCEDDIDRYHYRNSQVSEFLKLGDINMLRSSNPNPKVSRSMALLDDRNNASVSRENMAGKFRLIRGPLNAHQLYIELQKHVSSCYFPQNC